jgi:two-component system nitrate/nitrite response regulator NarL
MAAPTFRVVIADDVAALRMLVRIVLHESGRFDVVGEAADGEQALAAARRLHPDAALVDVQLPDTTGFALARRLTDGNRGVRIVHTTPDPTLGAGAAIAESGAVAFVPKDELAVSDLATWLDRRSSG